MNFIENESAQKLRGGYYTPEDLATYIAKWVNNCAPSTILEPSCGDGIFTQAFANINVSKKTKLTAFELLQEESQKAKSRSLNFNYEIEVRNEDFLGWAIKKMVAGPTIFDGVVGNPPFIRYQYLPADAQVKAEMIFKILHLKFTKHTNAWVPFILASLALLKPGGRLGMIVPAEIIHVMHAQSLRSYLGDQCSRLLVIDPEELWFENTLQGAVILFAEKKSSSDQHGEGLSISKVSGKNFMQKDPDIIFDAAIRLNGFAVAGKWTNALLSQSERNLLDEIDALDDVRRFDEIASVDVGIVTGANKFFLVPNETVEEFGLHEYAFPMFGRSEHCPGIIYDHEQHCTNAASGKATNFIWIKSSIEDLPIKVQKYIELGEEQNLHTRYKCKIRTPWFTVPSVRTSKIGMLKRSHDTPKLILNEIGAYTTDTAYRIGVREGVDEVKLVYCFSNALTALTAELQGRHYGGGVLELVPSEIEKLSIVLPRSIKEIDLVSLNNFVRANKAHSVLEKQTKEILDALGLGSKEQSILLDAWLRLKNRRQRISEIDC